LNTVDAGDTFVAALAMFAGTGSGGFAEAH
jgi:hypothetical protein